MKEIILLLIMLPLVTFNVGGQEIPIPENYTILDTVSGDLDKDGQNEIVVAYNTNKDTGQVEGTPRELRIYKLKDGEWELWQSSTQALYESREGGMMGDPFEQMEIKNGALLISQSGGSSWKWGHTDKYRFQNDAFYLIGYTSIAGKPCEYWKEVDFNLLTGKMIVKKEYEDCEQSEQAIYKRENETFYEKGISITLQNRQEKRAKIISPKYKHEIYL